ncbi:hypothetical protein EON79_03420 [bacterium]|nr:MAG: hypothetical protein EON79_03420 [bacterium]
MDPAALYEIETRLLDLTAKEKMELGQKLIEQARSESEPSERVDWSEFRGLLKDGPDPLEYQRAIRAEWD